MKQTFFLLATLMFIGMRTIDCRAQNLVIQSIDGSENSKELSTVDRLTFSNNNLLLSYLGGTSDSYSLSTIRKIVFKQTSSGTGDTILNDDAKKISVYPNPATDKIRIKNAPEGTFLMSVYRLDGVLVSSAPVKSGKDPVDVSTLAKGVYLISINNQTTVFTKL